MSKVKKVIEVTYWTPDGHKLLAKIGTWGVIAIREIENGFVIETRNHLEKFIHMPYQITYAEADE